MLFLQGKFTAVTESSNCDSIDTYKTAYLLIFITSIYYYQILLPKMYFINMS